MAIAIRNLTSRTIYLPLNSGTNLRLSPGGVSDQVHEVELKNNSKIEKLRLRRAIALETEEVESKDAAAQADKAATPGAAAGDASPAAAPRASESPSHAGEPAG